ncbi:hypothetical protein ASE01_00550 [Nocardioides sp. Root190]|nr:hypothetical protein ASE01_00550 [Nocardioides sp. Root190]
MLVRRLVQFACLAPSVHNTQPWRWRYDGLVLTLLADEDRRLTSSDPSGRNLTISCGAALHHLQFAARALACDAFVTLAPDHAPDGELARIRIHRVPGRPVVGEDIELIRSRCTDRRRFTAWPVPDHRMLQLCQVAEPWGVRAAAVLSDRDRIRLELLANRALTFLDLEAERRVEQDGWIDHGPVDGIPLDHLPDAPNPLQARTRFRPGLLEDTRLVIHGGDRVIAIGAATDDRTSWLRAGQALSAVWLEAARGGLSVVPMSQPIEVESIRREIAKSVLGNAFQPHILLQIGLQAIGRRELPRTPRRPVEEVLDARSD